MSLQVSKLVLCLLLELIVQSQGLKFSMDRSQNGLYCARLQCLTDSSIDNNTLSLISLSIYNITLANVPLKLVSISAFAPNVIVEPTAINAVSATGAISKNQADILLDFLSDVDCLQASFQCELDFVNLNGQPDVIRVSVRPDNVQNG
ncbi:hypothetical protein BsWGS_03332 [Bradybaena similaris]